MSSPPPDRGATPDEAVFEGDADADTGPVFVVGPNGEETAAANWGQGYYPPEDDRALKTHFWHPDPAPPTSAVEAARPEFAQPEFAPPPTRPWWRRYPLTRVTRAASPPR